MGRSGRPQGVCAEPHHGTGTPSKARRSRSPDLPASDRQAWVEGLPDLAGNGSPPTPRARRSSLPPNMTGCARRARSRCATGTVQARTEPRQRAVAMTRPPRSPPDAPEPTHRDGPGPVAWAWTLLVDGLGALGTVLIGVLWSSSAPTSWRELTGGSLPMISERAPLYAGDDRPTCSLRPPIPTTGWRARICSLRASGGAIPGGALLTDDLRPHAAAPLPSSPGRP